MERFKNIYSESEIQKAIDEILKGHSEKFEIIYDAYYKMISSIVRRILHPSPSEIEAIINECFLLVYKSLKGFKKESKFSTYIYRIVLNHTFKLSKKQRKHSSNITFYGEDNNNTIENIASSDRKEENIINQQLVEQAVSSLNKDMQEVIDLYYFEDYAIKEIADITKTTETTVKNRLHQARKKIKQFLNQGDDNVQ
ncbi:MAG: RNA polymerase sigma factor [Brevinemataceae bacterium]